MAKCKSNSSWLHSRSTYYRGPVDIVQVYFLFFLLIWHITFVILRFNWRVFYYRDPYYYIFFSTHLFTGPHYQTEVARSLDILGPYERLSTPISHTDFERYLDGMNCTFVAPGMHKVFICICVYFFLWHHNICNCSPYNSFRAWLGDSSQWWCILVFLPLLEIQRAEQKPTRSSFIIRQN